MSLNRSEAERRGALVLWSSSSSIIQTGNRKKVALVISLFPGDSCTPEGGFVEFRTGYRAFDVEFNYAIPFLSLRVNLSVFCVLESGVRVCFSKMNPSNGKGSVSMASSSGGWKAGDVVLDQFPAGLRVLVVDDDPTCLVILEKMLRACLYEGILL